MEEPQAGSVTAGGGAPERVEDIEAVIQAFLQDASRISLELPTSLTADQRKQARRLADQHPEVKCESFGFGAERQLHLFKKGSRPAEDASGGAVRVKNTFIDGWVGDEGSEDNAEPLAFRSMPVALLERTLQRCMVVQGATDGPQSLPEDLSTTATASPRAGTPAEGSSTASCSTSSGPGFAGLPEGLQVRNTFIHIESMPVVERIVQSMPDGMFRQCLQAELSAQQPDSEAVRMTALHEGSAAAAPLPAPAVAEQSAPVGAPPATVAPTEGDFWAPGTEVITQGLTKLPDFNGLTGVVQALDPETGRYDVLLQLPASSCGWKWVKVKGDNLRPSMPPPPRNAPTLSMECGESTAPRRTDDCLQAAAAGDAARAGATPLTLNALV